MRPLKNAIENQSLYDDAQNADLSRLSDLVSTDKIIFWKNQMTLLKSSDDLFADQSSVILVVNVASTGIIYSLTSGPDQEAVEISISEGMIRAIRRTNSRNYSFIEVPLPLQISENGKIILAASFAAEADQITLLVNGWVQTASIQKVGNPLEFSYLHKEAKLLTSFFGDGGEVVIYSDHLPALDLNVMSRHLAMGANVSNVVYDPLINTLKRGGVTPSLENPKFLAAKKIIDAKCISCHSSSNFGDFRELSQTQFLQRNLVSTKSLSDSKLYYRLQGVTVGPGPRDMPRGDALSAVEIQTIADWINSI